MSVHDPLPDILDLGTIALFNGSPNAGKTAFLAAFLKRLVEGGELFGFHVTPTPVQFIAMDRLWKKGAAKWFAKEGWDIPVYSFPDDRTTSPDNFSGKLPWMAYTGMLDSLNMASGTLIVTDPMENCYGDVMDRRKVITASVVLQRYLDDHQFCQVGVMHSGKMRASKQERYANVHEQMAGTGVLSGYSSAQMSLLSPEQSDSSRYELHITSHNLPSMLIFLERDEQGRYRLDDFEFGKGDEKQPTDAFLQSLLGLLPEHPAALRSRDIHDAVGVDVSTRTVERALRELERIGLAVHPAKGFWSRVPAGPKTRQ